ncbi:MAG: hypothetical protein CMP11_06500 [Zetaproteobacteria bacterium]|nr:hypothetical protein [Pseudobdellovibrionaceae bacterium]|tara:strand:- start:673 stop:1692 length:1020 start_codon:yes stop_codon:yes gene_type:complete
MNTKEGRQQLLSDFLKAVKQLDGQYGHLKYADFAYMIYPKHKKTFNLPATKKITLTFMAITHGNELAGVSAFLHFLNDLKEGKRVLNFPVAFILGNYQAYIENKRFIESDLNRSFHMDQASTMEQCRAKELSTILQETCYLIDFHQTIEPTIWPFYIFPYTNQAYKFARVINPHLAIVTHWGKGFSKDGLCTDEYVNSFGGVGISFESGQKGYDDKQVQLIIETMTASLSVVEKHFLHTVSALTTPSKIAKDSAKGDIYTWHKVIPYPKGSHVKLVEGLKNFSFISKGDFLGVVGDKKLYSPESGEIIFPKYIKENVPLSQYPKELLRIMKKVSEDSLP